MNPLVLRAAASDLASLRLEDRVVLTSARHGTAALSADAARIDPSRALGKTATLKRGTTVVDRPAKAAAIDLDLSALRALIGSEGPTERSRPQQVPGQAPGQLAGLTPGQLDGLQRLRDTAVGSDGFSVSFNRRVVPSHLAARDLSRPAPVVLRSLASPSSRMRAFLQDNRELLQLDDPDTELVLAAVDTDMLGKRRLRYRQQYRGIPVWGAESFGHFSERDEIFLFQSGHLPTRSMPDTRPELAAESAVALAAESLGAPDQVSIESTELVIYEHPTTGEIYLAWHLTAVRGGFEAWHIFVDAHSARVVARHTTANTGVVQGSGQSLSGSMLSFKAWQHSKGGYGMIDVTRPTDDSATANPETTKGVGDVIILDAQNTTLDSIQRWSVAASSSATSGWPAAAVSAVGHTYKVLDYFKNTHGRNGIDGKGGSVTVAVNVKDGGPMYAPQANLVVMSAAQADYLSNSSACFDIIAHEMTHGVVNFTATLEYTTQSGALNEHLADFFAIMAERTKWTVGNGCYLPNGGVLRNLADPERGGDWQPRVMSQYKNLSLSQDHGGVHINGGIPSYAAYLAADGLTATGLGTSIGKDKTEKIWFRALTSYLKSRSQFVDMRRATVQAAVDLYGSGSAEEAVVRKVWDLVEVTDTATGSPVLNEPTDVTPASGEDQILFTYNQGIYIKTSAGTIGPINRYAAHTSRPAVYSSSLGTAVFYVTSTGALQGIDLTSQTEQTITASAIWAVAISPSGNRLAFIPAGAGPYIGVIDMATSKTASFRLTMPSMDSTAAFTTIVAPDVISFDYSGNFVVFDALNEVKTSNFGTLDFWAVGVLDVRDGNIVAPVPAQDPLLSIGNPSFAANNNYILAWDIVDSVTGEAGVVLQNLQTGKISGVNPDLNGLRRKALGRPGFIGDDSQLLIKTCSGYVTVCPDQGSFYYVPITRSGDSWTLDATKASMIPSTQAFGDYPIPFRKGGRTLTAAISVSAGSLNFGSISVGASKTLDITVSNSGTMDVVIQDISLSGAAFQYDAINGLLPRGQSMKVTVKFVPTQAGASNGTLTIKSDATSGTQSVSLTGTATTTAPTTGTTTSQTDCLFTWVEGVYRDLFVPAGVVSQMLGTQYYYRYYPTTNSYLGRDLATDHLVYLGSASDNKVLDVGAMSTWLAQAGCAK